jgi:hypothetical protein
MHKCKDCLGKEGYILKATGCHTVRRLVCDDCGELKIIWPLRHFIKQKGVKNEPTSI